MSPGGCCVLFPLISCFANPTLGRNPPRYEVGRHQPACCASICIPFQMVICACIQWVDVLPAIVYCPNVQSHLLAIPSQPVHVGFCVPEHCLPTFTMTFLEHTDWGYMLHVTLAHKSLPPPHDLTTYTDYEHVYCPVARMAQGLNAWSSPYISSKSRVPWLPKCPQPRSLQSGPMGLSDAIAPAILTTYTISCVERFAMTVPCTSMADCINPTPIYLKCPFPFAHVCSKYRANCIGSQTTT